MKTQPYFEMDYGEFEDLVNKTYSVKNYSFVADVECGNDSHHVFEVEARPLDEYEANRLKEAVAKNVFRYTAYILFQDLCHRGLLEPGKYLVGVSW